MPRPCLESECRHCLRNGQTDEGTIETVRVHGERHRGWVEVTEREALYHCTCPEMGRIGAAAAILGGRVSDEWRRQDLLGSVGQSPIARESSLPARRHTALWQFILPNIVEQRYCNTLWRTGGRTSRGKQDVREGTPKVLLDNVSCQCRRLVLAVRRMRSEKGTGKKTRSPLQ